MYSRHRMGPVCALIALGITSSAAIADLPVSRVVKYHIRETPTDPESDVIFLFALKVTARERDGGLVAWKISEVRIKEPPSPVRLWIDDSPSTPSADGLWWIDHADGEGADGEGADGEGLRIDQVERGL
ncbi:MAG: hypothetical protein IH988_06035, partial [Planctomycetes bacterium]|nr:hypothetical protein [Planctomycetota bacterium]